MHCRQHSSLVCDPTSDFKPFDTVLAGLAGWQGWQGIAVLGRAVMPWGGCAFGSACSLHMCLDFHLSLSFATRICHSYWSLWGGGGGAYLSLSLVFGLYGYGSLGQGCSPVPASSTSQLGVWRCPDRVDGQSVVTEPCEGLCPWLSVSGLCCPPLCPSHLSPCFDFGPL